MLRSTHREVREPPQTEGSSEKIATLFHSVTGAAFLVGLGFALTGFMFIALGGSLLLALSPFLCGLTLIGLSFWGVITGRR